MDLSKDIVYRNYLVNYGAIASAVTGGGGLLRGIAGCVVDSADFSDVDVSQFMEKRPEQDGVDVGVVSKGMRRLRLSGTLYATSKELLYDALLELRATFDPVLAQADSPADHGYQPFYFYMPTANADDSIVDGTDLAGGLSPGYPDRNRRLKVLAMPRSFQTVEQRDMLGDSPDNALAIPWSATLVCKDPHLYSDLAIIYELDDLGQAAVTGTTADATTNVLTKTGHGLVAGDIIMFSSLTGGGGLSISTKYYVSVSSLTSSTFKLSTSLANAQAGTNIDITSNMTASTWVKSITTSGVLYNRGNYFTPLDMLLEVDSKAGSLVVSAGDANFTITVPASTGNRIIRYKGTGNGNNVLTVEENGVEVPRLDLLTSSQNTMWANVPGGASNFDITVHGTLLQSGSQMSYYEAFA